MHEHTDSTYCTDLFASFHTNAKLPRRCILGLKNWLFQQQSHFSGTNFLSTFPFSVWQNICQKQLKEGSVYFSSWFHFVLVGRAQWGGHGGGKESLWQWKHVVAASHSVPEQKITSGYNLPSLLNAPQPLKAVLPWRDQGFKHTSLWRALCVQATPSADLTSVSVGRGGLGGVHVSSSLSSIKAVPVLLVFISWAGGEWGICSMQINEENIKRAMMQNPWRKINGILIPLGLSYRNNKARLNLRRKLASPNWKWCSMFRVIIGFKFMLKKDWL